MVEAAPDNISGVNVQCYSLSGKAHDTESSGTNMNISGDDLLPHETRVRPCSQHEGNNSKQSRDNSKGTFSTEESNRRQRPSPTGKATSYRGNWWCQHCGNEKKHIFQVWRLGEWQRDVSSWFQRFDWNELDWERTNGLIGNELSNDVEWRGTSGEKMTMRSVL